MTAIVPSDDSLGLTWTELGFDDSGWLSGTGGAGYDAITGKELWKERLGGNYSGSPVVAGGVVYAASEEGEILVIKAAKEAKVVSRTQIGKTNEEVFRSSLAIHNGQLLLRSDHRLYCVGK